MSDSTGIGTNNAAAAARISLAFAAVKFCLQAACLKPYGYFRDELYYLACANHLAFGYVDHPPFSVAFLAAWRAIFGDSIVAIRLVPALAGALLVWVTGRIVIQLRGGPVAVTLACLAVLCAPAFVGTDHTYSMNAFDHLFWATSALCILRVFENPKIERWAMLGSSLGLGLENKISVLWLGAGLALTLVTLREGRALLRTSGPYLAAAVAGLLFAPHVVWQIRNHFPTIEFMHNAMDKYRSLSLVAFARESTLALNPATLPLTLAGLITPYATPSQRKARPLAILFLTTFTIIASTKSAKPEYLDVAYPLVFASGAVWWETLIARKNSRIMKVVALAMGTAMILFLAMVLPFGLPVLSETTFIAYAKKLGVAPQSSEKKELSELPQHYADMHGWDELVASAKVAYDTLSPDEKIHARIWAVDGGYGSAAAIDVLGSRLGLPHAISGHNNYWPWGYGSDDVGPVILLGGPEDRLRVAFPDLTRVTTVECGYCMPYENHKAIYVAREMAVPWQEIWPKIKHYN